MAIRTKPKSRNRFTIGLMSGTSADGIDAVIAEISGHGPGMKVRLIAHQHSPFSRAVRERILKVCVRGAVAEICELNFLLGELFARATQLVLRKARLQPGQVAAIGSHGQTIHHLPNSRTPSTLQIGESSVIAEKTGITTVANFRTRDMAAGGQGAPLVPYADWVLFTDKTRPRIIQNIGGIGNLTYLPPGAGLEKVVAFDTGPGNMVIDAVVAKLSKGRLSLDANGKWARSGKVSEKLLSELMAHPFLKREPPKTTGREEFGAEFCEKLLHAGRRMKLSTADIVATTTALTAASIADAYRRFVFKRLSAKQCGKLQIILGGGGARNSTLVRYIRERVGVGEHLTHENFGIPNGAKEALAFAILAHETLGGRAGNVPNATGAGRAVILGNIVPGPFVRGGY